MLSITTLFASLAQLGVNLTEKQLTTLKWRLSPDGKKYYSIKETNKFYRAVEGGDTDTIDIARKERQMTIKELKRKLGLLSIMFLFLFLGCDSIPKKIPHLDVAALKANEVSYEIKDQEVYCFKKRKTVEFEGIWYVVHRDYVKEHIENQDDLIKSLEREIDLRNKNRIFSGSTIALGFGFFLVIIILALVKRK